VSDLQFAGLLVLGAIWPVYAMVHDAYEFVIDEWNAWRLRRLVRKLYWFIDWRK
jgi:hypothetical protein